MPSQPRTILRREHWMSRKEWRHALLFRRLYLQRFCEAEIPLTIEIAVVLKDYLTQLTLTRRAERALVEPEEDSPNAPALGLLDSVYKSQDRLKKAQAELRALLPETAASAPGRFPARRGFKPASEMQPPPRRIDLSNLPPAIHVPPCSPETGPFYEPDTPGGPFFIPDPNSPQAIAYRLKKAQQAREEAEARAKAREEAKAQSLANATPGSSPEAAESGSETTGSAHESQPEASQAPLVPPLSGGTDLPALPRRGPIDETNAAPNPVPNPAAAQAASPI